MGACPRLLQACALIFCVPSVCHPVASFVRHPATAVRIMGMHSRHRSDHAGIPRCAIQTYCPDQSRPQVQSLNPPVPSSQLPPLIHHIVTEDPAANISSVLEQHASITVALAQELIAFGAVWVAFPDPGSKNQHGVGKPQRTLQEEELPAGTYLRVHVNPKRHLLATQVDWASRIVEQTHDYVVVDKPQGVPTVPTVDNLKECVLHQVSQLLQEDLLVTSRLDKCTSGVLVFARTKEACEKMNRCLRERQVDKTYRLLSYKPLPLGAMQHLFKRKRGGHKNAKPSLLREFDAALLPREGNDKGSDWQLAKLEVLSCAELPPDVGRSASSKADPGVAFVGSSLAGSTCLYDCEVKLVTGRTHQVRLQVAAAGGGIVGDSRYLPVAGLLDTTEPSPATLDANQDAPPAPAATPAPAFGPEPDVVALQASSVRILSDVTRTADSSHPGEAAGRQMWSEDQDAEDRAGRWHWRAGLPWWEGDAGWPALQERLSVDRRREATCEHESIVEESAC